MNIKQHIFKFEPGDVIIHKASGEKMVVLKQRTNLLRNQMPTSNGYDISGGFMRLWNEYQDVLEVIAEKK